MGVVGSLDSFFSAPVGDAEYCVQCVCVSVCVIVVTSVCMRIAKTICPDVTKFSVHVAYGCGSVRL